MSSLPPTSRTLSRKSLILALNAGRRSSAAATKCSAGWTSIKVSMPAFSAKHPMYLQQLSRIALKPLRIAFDHLGVKKHYAQAIRFAAEAKITELSNYMLYNFHDSPHDLFERMGLNVDLNEELGIRIFSFPMRYQPVTRPDRGHVGKNWNSYYLRSMQVILQARTALLVALRNSSGQHWVIPMKSSREFCSGRTITFLIDTGMRNSTAALSSIPFSPL